MALPYTFAKVASSSALAAILVRRDSHLHVGDFIHHPEGRAIVLELVYKGMPMQAVNVYMCAKGTAKEYRPLLRWLCAHVAPDSRSSWEGISNATRGGRRIVCPSTPRSPRYCLSLSLIWLCFRSPMACPVPHASVRKVLWVLWTFSSAAVSLRRSALSV